MFNILFIMFVLVVVADLFKEFLDKYNYDKESYTIFEITMIIISSTMLIALIILGVTNSLKL